MKHDRVTSRGGASAVLSDGPPQPWDAQRGNDVNGGNVFVDDNPRTPASERYKFVSTTKQPLTLYVSPDGVHFTEKGVIAGAWRTSGDTQPSLMWDVHSSTYLLYGRIDDPAGSYSTTRNCKGTLNGKAIDTTADRKVGFSQTANLSIAPPADPYVMHPFIHPLVYDSLLYI